MTFDDIRAEYQVVRIGPLILGEVQRAVRLLSSRYAPDIYAGSPTWEDAIGDVVQRVVLDVLLDESQLEYLMATASSLDDFRGLLAYQVRRYLARSRKRSVVDNLLDRAKEILSGPPIVSLPANRYAFETVPLDESSPTEEEILAAARIVALIPRVSIGRGDRAPIVYSRENLEDLIHSSARLLGKPFRLTDIGRILELVLTDWVASFLGDSEEVHTQEAPGLAPDDDVMIDEAVNEIMATWSAEDRLILRRKLETVPDARLADELGISRPTVIARKQRLMEAMRQSLEGLPERAQRAAIDAISLHLAVRDE